MHIDNSNIMMTMIIPSLYGTPQLHVMVPLHQLQQFAIIPLEFIDERILKYLGVIIEHWLIINFIVIAASKS